MTRAELEEAVRAILLEQMGGPQVLSLDLPPGPGYRCGPAGHWQSPGPSVDPRPSDPVSEPPPGAGLMVMENTTFPWHLTYDEIDYVIEGTLTVHAQSGSVTAGPGQVIFIPKGSQIQFFRPGIRPVFVCDLSRRLAESAVLNLPGQNKSPSQRGCYEAGSS